MSANLQALKDAVDFTALVGETHEINRGGKVICPFHSDHTPSCHVYADGAHCYSCGWHADHVDWLEVAHGLSKPQAIRELERRAAGYLPTNQPRCTAKPHNPSTEPVKPEVLAAHYRQASRLPCVPTAMRGRGFELSDLRRLGVAASGGDVVIPIAAPNGAVLALKKRHAEPRHGQRYRYITCGHGTPAWCSPGFTQHDEVLVIEGELNGMACWLALSRVAVMGVAGTGGTLHLQALRNRTVYVYADGDEPGRKARDKWAAQAHAAGALEVYTLSPWYADACDIAGTKGRTALSNMLTHSFDAKKLFNAKTAASNKTCAGQVKSLLMQSCNNPRGLPHLGGSGRSGMASHPKLGGKPCL